MNFNCSLLLRRECCSFSNGEYVKAGLQELEQWCLKATDEVCKLNNLHQIYFQICIQSWGNNHTIIDVMHTFHSQFSGTSWDELQHIRQAIGFLVSRISRQYLVTIYISVHWRLYGHKIHRFCIRNLTNSWRRSQVNSAQ